MKRYTWFICAALAALAVFVTCNNHFGIPDAKKPPPTDGMGRVEIRIAGTGARTFLPDLSGLNFNLTIVPTGETTPIVNEIFDKGKLSWSGLINRGTYTVSIVGYETDITFPALRGANALTVTAGETNNITVVLYLVETEIGTLSFNVSIPETMNFPSGELRIEAISQVPSPNPFNLVVDGMSGSITLQPGYYRVFMEVTGISEDQMGIYKTTFVAHIIDAVTTRVVYQLTEDVFNYMKYFTVTFDSYGGNDISSQFIPEGRMAVTPENIFKGGYAFTGWYSDPDLSIGYDFSTPVTNDVSLYAKWNYNASLNIGDTGMGGGKIFYRSDDGFPMIDNGEICHYLEAAPDDAVNGPVYFILRALDMSASVGTSNNYDIGRGRYNTNRILAALQDDALAAKACSEYSSNGRTDWFLPSRNELNYLILQKGSINNLADLYWSSTEYHWNTMWVYFGGDYVERNKKSYAYVRPIRAF